MIRAELFAVAGLVGVIGVNVFMYRVKRETEMERDGERTWIPLADFLVLGALVLDLVAVLVLLLQPERNTRLPWTLLAVAVALIVGFIPSILAHYRLLGGANRTGPRDRAEPFEKVCVGVSLAAAAIVGVLVWHGAA